MARILVTGAAGFIGMHVCRQLLGRGDEVVGLDNLNDYYSPQLKMDRLAELSPHASFSFHRLDLADREALRQLFAKNRFDAVCHLAAQAGMRHSLHHPEEYIDSNVVGFLSVLEGCRHNRVGHLMYASSSSVYGAGGELPFSEGQSADRPVSLYAATKRANELMAYSYSHLYDLPTTGLRFFTVYGPWGRPDMALWKFTAAILADKPVELYDRGMPQRDFTYIDDAAQAAIRLLDQPPCRIAAGDSSGNGAEPFRLYNIGGQQPAPMARIVELLEECLGRKAEIQLLPSQPGDLAATCADVSLLQQAIGFQPQTPIEVGVNKFVQWYREYHA